MAITQKDSAPSTLTVGGSPRGWSFIGSSKCWRAWALRYLVGIFPTTTKSYFDLGSAYHALMEGVDDAIVAKRYPNHIDAARELQKTRLTKGPPLGRATAVEREVAIFSGLMTSKPDREECEGKGSKPTLIRDYKSAMSFSDNDELSWNMDPGILGEMVAAGVTRGIVDIVSKRVESSQRVKLVPVFLTPEKEQALKAAVMHFWYELERRLMAVHKAKTENYAIAATQANFGPNLTACVGKYGACEYYARCWGKPPESLLYKKSSAPPRAWVHGKPELPLTLPGVLYPELVEQVASKVETALTRSKKEVPT